MTNTQVLGLHGPRVRLIMSKTFEDFEAMSVT